MTASNFSFIILSDSLLGSDLKAEPVEDWPPPPLAEPFDKLNARLLCTRKVTYLLAENLKLQRKFSKSAVKIPVPSLSAIPKYASSRSGPSGKGETELCYTVTRILKRLASLLTQLPHHPHCSTMSHDQPQHEPRRPRST